MQLSKYLFNIIPVLRSPVN